MEDEFIEIEEGDLLTGDSDFKIDTSDISEPEEKKVDSEEKIDIEDVKIDEDEFDVPEELPLDKKEDLDEEDVPSDNEKEEDVDDNDSTEKLNPFSAFGSNLYEKGFFPNMSEEDILKIEDEEGLSDILENQLQKSFGDWKDKYKQNLVGNLVRDGYVNKTELTEKLPQTYTDEQIEQDLDVAKAVIKKFYERTGTPESVTNKMIENLDDVEQIAKDLNLKNKELDLQEQTNLSTKLKAQEEEAKVQRETFVASLKENTMKFDQFIPGRKLKAKDKEEVFLNIEPTLNKINSDLGKYGPLLSYLDKYKLLDGNFDKIIKDIETKKVSNFSKIITEKGRKKGSNGSRNDSHNTPRFDGGDVTNIYK